MRNRKDQNQSGNAVLFVLLAVVLLGALIFTFTNSGQQSVSRMSKNEIKLEAQEILYYGQALEKAVQRVRGNGCSENQISFNYDSDGDGNYIDGGDSHNNPNAPSDLRCHVFRDEGGKMQWKNIGANREVRNGPHCVYGIGAWCNGTVNQGPELMLYTRFGSGAAALELCQEINYQLGTRNKGQAPPIENLSFNYGSGFSGTFGATPANSTNGLSGAGISQEPISCVNDTTGNPGGYNMYYTLLAR